MLIITSAGLSVDFELGSGGSSIPNGSVDNELLSKKNVVDPLTYFDVSSIPTIANPNLIAVDFPVSGGPMAMTIGHPLHNESRVS